MNELLGLYDLMYMIGEPVFIDNPKNNEKRWGILDWVHRSQDSGDTFGVTDNDIGYNLNETKVYKTKKDCKLERGKRAEMGIYDDWLDNCCDYANVLYANGFIGKEDCNNIINKINGRLNKNEHS